jgi:hypothetical protein
MDRRGKRATGGRKTSDWREENERLEGQHYWLEFTDIFRDFGGAREGVSVQAIELMGWSSK